MVLFCLEPAVGCFSYYIKFSFSLSRGMSVEKRPRCHGKLLYLGFGQYSSSVEFKGNIWAKRSDGVTCFEVHV